MQNSVFVQTALQLGGVLVVIVSMGADYIGLGQDWGVGFGYKQWLGTIAGVILLLTGLILGNAKEEVK